MRGPRPHISTFASFVSAAVRRDRVTSDGQVRPPCRPPAGRRNARLQSRAPGVRRLTARARSTAGSGTKRAYGRTFERSTDSRLRRRPCCVVVPSTSNAVSSTAASPIARSRHDRRTRRRRRALVAAHRWPEGVRCARSRPTSVAGRARRFAYCSASMPVAAAASSRPGLAQRCHGCRDAHDRVPDDEHVPSGPTRGPWPASTSISVSKPTTCSTTGTTSAARLSSSSAPCRLPSGRREPTSKIR